MRHVRATTAAHTRGATTAAPMPYVLAVAATDTSAMRYVLATTAADTLAGIAAAMRDVLTAAAADTLAGIAGATKRDVLATVHCGMTLTSASATAAGINNPLATAAAKVQSLFTAAAIAKPLLGMNSAVPVSSYVIAATRSVYRDVVSVPIDVAARPRA